MQFQQEQQQQNKASGSELQGIVIQGTDRYAVFDSMPPTSVVGGQQNNQNKAQGYPGSGFDNNFSSLDGNNFSNNTGTLNFALLYML